MFHIGVIITAFSLAFHYLLSSHPAFKSFGNSVIKTLVWMLGDLAYDDIFHQEDHYPKYPIESNILFVIFVTTIAAFIYNVYEREMSDENDRVKKLTEFYEHSGNLKLCLLIDGCLNNFRKRNGKKRITIDKDFLSRPRSSVEELGSINCKHSIAEEHAEIVTDRKMNEFTEKITADKEQLTVIAKKMIADQNRYTEDD